MKEDQIYIFSLIIIDFILALCVCRYNNIKKENYFNQFNNNQNQNKNNIYVNNINNQELRRLHGCTGDEFKKKMYHFYKNLDEYQKTYQEKQETLHRYEDLTDKLDEVKKQLIRAEDDVKECILIFQKMIIKITYF